MKRLFKSNVCTKFCSTPTSNELRFVLPGNIGISKSNSLSDALLPGAMAFTGGFIIFFGLRYVNESLFRKGLPHRHMEAREEHDLKSKEFPNSDLCSKTSSSYPGEEQYQSVLQMLKPMMRTVPDLSSIIHSQVFGNSSLHCITTLKGVDIAPQKACSPQKANEPVISRGKKPGKSRPPKKTMSLVSESSEKTEDRSRAVRCSAAIDKAQKKGEQVPAAVKADVAVNSESPENLQSQASKSNVKKPRRRHNREPRPRFKNQRQHSRVPETLSQEGRPAVVGDDKKTAELPRSKTATLQKEAQGIYSQKESSQVSSKKKHRSRKKSLGQGNEKTSQGRAGDKRNDPAVMQNGKELHGKPAPKQGIANGSSSSGSANPSLWNAPQSHFGKQPRQTCDVSSYPQGYSHFAGPSNNRTNTRHSSAQDGANLFSNDPRGNRLPTDASRWSSLRQEVRYSSIERLHRLGPRLYRPPRNYVDLDKPQ